MPELLFHHYDASPFSEKIRVIFGIKGLRWRAVPQPNVMPKPQLLPLTGGYRRIPVLQIGADVWCDSQAIARVLERLYPAPTLYPGASEGVCHAFSLWADRLLFFAAVPVLFSTIGPAVPKAFVDDRTKLMGGRMDFAEVMQSGGLAKDQLRAHAALLDAQLRDGRAFLLGDAPSLADAAAYHPVWFLRGMPPTAGSFATMPRVEAWAERVKALGHGIREACTPEEALEIARVATPTTLPQTDPEEPGGLAAGMAVQVVPDDYGFDPVSGELVTSSVHEVAVRRRDPVIGDVVVHFPRAGFRVVRA